MIQLQIKLNNRTEYAVYNSLWGANIIAYEMIQRNNGNNGIEKIHIVDTETGELYRTYINGMPFSHIVENGVVYFSEVTTK